MSKITPVEFYQGKPLLLKNGENLTVEQILSKSNDWWDGCHDFIQWMFPTRTPSEYCVDAPILTFDTAKYIQENHSMMIGLCGERFLKFLESQNMDVFNHNHLRVTRLIECNSLILNTFDSNMNSKLFLTICNRLLPIQTMQYMDGTQEIFKDYDRKTLKYWMTAYMSKW